MMSSAPSTPGQALSTRADVPPGLPASTSADLRRSLARLDVAARARFVSAGVDIEVIVVDVAHRLESRARGAIRQRLHTNAIAIVGATFAIGLLLSLVGRPLPRPFSSPRGTFASPSPRKTP